MPDSDARSTISHDAALRIASAAVARATEDVDCAYTPLQELAAS